MVRCPARGLFEPQLRVRGDLAVQRQFRADRIPQPACCPALRLQAHFCEALLHAGIRHRGAGGLVQAIDHHGRRGRRHQDAHPGLLHEALEPGFHRRRRVRETRIALFARHRQQLHAAGVDQRLGCAIESQVELAAGHVVQCARGRLVGDVDQEGAAERLEVLTGEMCAAADAGAAVTELARIFLRMGDELLQCVHRQARGGDDLQAVGGGHAHWDQRLRRVGQLLVDDGQEAEARIGEQQDAAIRRRLRRGIHTEATAGARPVLHDDGLPELLPHLLGHDAGRLVGDATGRKRHHPLQNVGLRVGQARRGGKGGGEQRPARTAKIHVHLDLLSYSSSAEAQRSIFISISLVFVIPAEAGTQSFRVRCALSAQFQCPGSPPPRG